MRYVRPDFYDKFKCIADKCKHSCCVGWEIDIDEDSLEYYVNLDGDIGRQLRDNIEKEPEPHFRLCGNERCPFLENSGLCRLISELGEESLCNICAEHPRFYNCFDNREEAGLGLCCEEAARLLLEGTGGLKLISEGGEPEEDELIRDKLFTILDNREMPLVNRFSVAMKAMGYERQMHSLAEWAEFFLRLERLDDSWTEKLLLLRDKANLLDINCALENIRYQRLCQYFIYRHLLSADDYSLVLEFCILATEMIAALDALSGFDIENTRLFSSEIEYSDENIALILEKIEENRE